MVEPDMVEPDMVEPDMVEPDVVDTMTECPSCHAAVADTEQFCEACGAELSPTAAAPEPPATQVDTREVPRPDDLDGTASTCATCGGEVFSDGYCGTCGTRAPTRRDHFTEQPAAWVAAVCDRGIRHTRNEDAVALAADPAPGSRAVIVVCDGVSNSIDSDVASLAAARAARDVLQASRSRGMGTASSLVAAVTASLALATDSASEAVLDVTRSAKAAATTTDPAGNPASCTFVAAVVDQDLLVVGSVGDSRAYWLPDVGTAVALTVDDSFSQEQIAGGVPREEAETGPHSHAITRWLGVDAPDHTPTTATMALTDKGWLLLCSDGLWNYCSAAPDLADLVRQTVDSFPAAAEPLTLAGALVDWANTQGGQDNITVALARIDPSTSHPVPPERKP